MEIYYNSLHAYLYLLNYINWHQIINIFPLMFIDLYKNYTTYVSVKSSTPLNE